MLGMTSATGSTSTGGSTSTAGSTSADQRKTFETGKRQMPQPTTYYASCTCTMIVVVWQSTVLSGYTSSFPFSVITGAHGDLNNSCLSLFQVLNLSLYLSVFVMLTDVAMLLFAAAGESEDALMFLASFFDYSAMLARFFLLVMSVWAFSHSITAEEISTCADLYECAWWCAFGIFLISIVVVFCFLCCTTTDSARAMLGHSSNQVGERPAAVTFGDTDVWEHKVSAGNFAVGPTKSELWDGTDTDGKDGTDNCTDFSERDEPKDGVLQTPTFAS